MDLENAKAQMRKGILELCILSIIHDEESYPGDIISRLKESNLIVVEGTLYPLLTRLKNDGLLDYSWRESTSGPPRKYFKITEAGLGFYDSMKSSWEELVLAVKHVTTQATQIPPAQPESYGEPQPASNPENL
jgi:PadR family transcriptional regulator, regulatory protein PadR